MADSILYYVHFSFNCGAEELKSKLNGFDNSVVVTQIFSNSCEIQTVLAYTKLNNILFNSFPELPIYLVKAKGNQVHGFIKPKV